ncbi:hypothetical protein COS83_05060, partial [archaeon CG07_land_8_20_14_0_80_38_8]
DLKIAILKLFAKLNPAECVSTTAQLLEEDDFESGVELAKMVNALGDEEIFCQLKESQKDHSHVIVEMALAMHEDKDSTAALLGRLST